MLKGNSIFLLKLIVLLFLYWIFTSITDVRRTTTSTVLPTEPVGPICDKIRIDYDIATAVICAMCFIFGILYTFFG